MTRTKGISPPKQNPASSTQAAAANDTSRSPRASADSLTYRERVFEIVRRIPAGRVMTYGQISEILGEGYDARTVGYCMHGADDTVPWHRVINAQGACSTGRIVLPANKQQLLLEAEGIHFDSRARCDLGQYRWTPPEAAGESPETMLQSPLF